MDNYKKILILILLFTRVFYSFSQGADTLLIQKYEEILGGFFEEISNSSNDFERERINNLIVDSMEQVLSIERSFSYNFDSLKNVGKIISPDNKLRIFTWNLPYINGTHKYFGFMQYYPADDNKFLLYKLVDCSDSYESPENLILNDTSWLGALYYEIIENKYNDFTYYTLLGFDFNSLLTAKKIIEVLYFKDNKKPVFGNAIFNYRDKLHNRIIFEYSAKVTMSLKYNTDLKMIVFDHLSPSKPSYTGHYMYYGPDFSYDGFEFKNGIWQEVRDLDVRNPAY